MNSVNGPIPLDWTPLISAMVAEWTALVTRPARTVEWDSSAMAMAKEMGSLKAVGAWRPSRGDLLYAVRRGGDELVHSNMLAWLLRPHERHGLGSAFLRDVVRHTWALEFDDFGTATVLREVRRTSRTKMRIADLVVTAATFRLVIENKVYSDEDKDQCEDLYQLWAIPPDDGLGPAETLFVLLTRGGGRPTSVHTSEADDAWRGLSWDWVENWLRQHVTSIASPIARSTVTQYIVTLHAMSGRKGT
jgi:hypothetical protein